jgi:uncharacterized protein (TIGR03118 family)
MGCFYHARQLLIIYLVFLYCSPTFFSTVYDKTCIMKRTFYSRNVFATKTLAFVLAGCMAFAVACKKDKPPKELKDFTQVNLVGNTDKYAPLRVDPLLINAWGLSWNPGGVAWVSSTGGGVSLVLNREGGQQRAPVAIPSPGGTTGGVPTGQVFHGGTGFLLPNGLPARFIFVGVDGILSAWNAGNFALVVKNNSATSAYTGMTIANRGTSPHLFAADFRAGKIEVWNEAWESVALPFKDPYLPKGYAPFNIEVGAGNLYVMYAKVGPDGRDVPGMGNGFVSIFTTEGQFVKRFASRGALNAPWGFAIAPDSFFVDTDADMDLKGGHDNDELSGPVVLVGNFGDGRINAYSSHGRFLGPIRKHGRALEIDGLWAISFAPTTSTIDQKRLYFTAGPDLETNGLFGYIIKD